MSKLDISGLSSEQVKILEELNNVTIKKLVSSDNAKLSDPSKNGKKGGKSRSDAKIQAAKANLLKAQQSYDYEELMRRAHLGGKNGGKKGGENARDMKVGIHSLTKEQLSENAKNSQSIVRECPHCGFISKGSNIFISHMDKCFMIGKDKESFDTELLKYGGITKLSNLHNISYWTLHSYKQQLTKNNG